MSLGIDYSATSGNFAAKRAKWAKISANSSDSTSSTSASNSNYDSYTSSSILGYNDNKCTDGCDDGKIGLFSAVSNTLEGAAKGVVNGVKGMFTDSSGNFSILQTAKTVALGAACVAFPAVGLFACGVGAVAGGVKLASGVYNAMNADTDAEAKEAWESVGEGGITVAASVAGAKASYSAVQSSAAAANGGTTAMSSLGKDATALQKVSALGKDMLTSTKYNAANIKNTIELEILRSKANKIDTNSALTDAEQATLKKLDAYEYYSSDTVKSQADMIDSAKNTVTNTIDNAKSKLPFAKKSAATSATSTGTTTTAATSGTTTTAATTTVKTKLASGLEVLKNMKNKVNLTNIKQQITSLPQRTQEIISFLAKEDGSYAQAVQNYGYTNVLSALEALGGVQMTNENI